MVAKILIENPHLSSLKITDYRILESERGVLEERETEMGSYKFCVNVCGWPLNYACTWQIQNSPGKNKITNWAENWTTTQEIAFVYEVNCLLNKKLTLFGRLTESRASKT